MHAMSAPGHQPDWLEHVIGLRESGARIEERVAGFEHRIMGLEQRVDRLETTMNVRFDWLEGEMSGMRKTLYALDAAQAAGLLALLATVLATQ